MIDKEEPVTEGNYVLGEVPTQYGPCAMETKTKAALTELQLLIKIANTVEKIQEDIQDIKKNIKV